MIHEWYRAAQCEADDWVKMIPGKAIAARDALDGVGPCPLPINDWEVCRLKDGIDDNDITAVRKAFWAYFARSLSSAPFWFDLTKHLTWERYMQAYLAN